MKTHPRRAIILGGGGVTGIAWEIGVLAALLDERIDLAGSSDALIGTSAGSFAATLLAARADMAARYRAQFEPDPSEVSTVMGPDIQEQFRQAIMTNFGRAVPLARAFGDIAKSATTVSTEVRTGVVRARLGVDDWPEGDALRFTAIDADTGEIVVLDRHSGLSITEAASASGAVPGIWPMVSAAGRKWIDGGMVTTTNVQLGEGYERVLVVAPSPDSMSGFDSVDEAADKLRSSGSSVVVITPDEATMEAIGPNVFDVTRRGASAEAGYAQGLRRAADVRSDWVGQR